MALLKSIWDESLFLKVIPGDDVLYEKNSIGKCYFYCGSRDPDAPTFLSNRKCRSCRNSLDSWIEISEYRITIKKPSTFSRNTTAASTAIKRKIWPLIEQSGPLRNKTSKKFMDKFFDLCKDAQD